MPVDVFPTHLEDFTWTHSRIEHEHQNISQRLIRHYEKLALCYRIDCCGPSPLLCRV